MSFGPQRLSVVIGALAVVALLIVLKLGPLKGDASPSGARGPRGSGGGPTAVQVTVLQAEAMSDRITTVGSLLANEAVEIRSETSGRVETISFEEGSRVTKGKPLVKIEDAEQKAELARAESRLKMAEIEAERQREMSSQDLTSQREVDNAQNELQVAKAEADLIRAQLAKALIRAPFEGKVGLRHVSEGSYVTPTTRITSLQDDTPMKIDFSVPERYAGRLKADDRIQFTVQGDTRTFEGTIYAIEPSIDAVTRTFGVRALSPNEDGALVPGAFADVEIVMQEREAVTIPAYALIPELKGHRVFVMSGGKAESRSVVIGARTDERVEILRGVSAGDTLITSAILELRPGASVTVADVEPAQGTQ